MSDITKLYKIVHSAMKVDSEKLLFNFPYIRNQGNPMELTCNRPKTDQRHDYFAQWVVDL